MNLVLGALVYQIQVQYYYTKDRGMIMTDRISIILFYELIVKHHF